MNGEVNSVQLLGTALPRQRKGLPDVGILADLRHPLILLPPYSHGSCRCTQNFRALGQGESLSKGTSPKNADTGTPLCAARLLLCYAHDARRLLVLRRGRLLPRLCRPHQLARRPLRPLARDVLGRPLQRRDRLPALVLRHVLCHARYSSESLACRRRVEAHLVRRLCLRRRRHRRVAVRGPPRRAARP